jgi:Protein of unknown function (DUF2782)
MLRRSTVVAMLLGCALPVAAQQPPKLEPLPEPPPPPPGVESEQPGEPSVEIGSGKQQAEETVVNGQRVVRVTQPDGTIYYLIEDRGDGPGLRNESLDIGLRVPAWVIRQF